MSVRHIPAGVPIILYIADICDSPVCKSRDIIPHRASHQSHLSSFMHHHSSHRDIYCRRHRPSVMHGIIGRWQMSPRAIRDVRMQERRSTALVIFRHFRAGILSRRITSASISAAAIIRFQSACIFLNQRAGLLLAAFADRSINGNLRRPPYLRLYTLPIFSPAASDKPIKTCLSFHQK